MAVAAALAKARAYCARQERAQQEVRDKLHAWEVPRQDIEPIIGQLIGEGFLNEARFAEHFAVSKARQKGWGTRRIEAALKLKRVSEPCVRAALEAIDAEEQNERLQRLVAARWAKDKEPDLRKRRWKLIAYFLGRGHTSAAVERAMQDL